MPERPARRHQRAARSIYPPVPCLLPNAFSDQQQQQQQKENYRLPAASQLRLSNGTASQLTSERPYRFMLFFNERRYLIIILKRMDARPFLRSSVRSFTAPPADRGTHKNEDNPSRYEGN